jgi:hypothetical protein
MYLIAIIDTSIHSIHSEAQIITANEGACTKITFFFAPSFLWLCQSAHYGSPLLQDAFIHTPFLQAHNDSEEEEVVSALVIIPNRDLRQARSSGGKLAYVIFGDQTTGIYYNWYDYKFPTCRVLIKLLIFQGIPVSIS